ncbi:thiamine biosynthesis protein MoeB, partial [Bacillus sp. D-CC]
IKTDDCSSCGLNRMYPYLSYENQTKVAALCGRNTVQIRSVENRQYNFDDLEKVLKKLGKVDRNPYLLSCQL